MAEAVSVFFKDSTGPSFFCFFDTAVQIGGGCIEVGDDFDQRGRRPGGGLAEEGQLGAAELYGIDDGAERQWPVDFAIAAESKADDLFQTCSGQSMAAKTSLTGQIAALAEKSTVKRKT